MEWNYADIVLSRWSVIFFHYLSAHPSVFKALCIKTVRVCSLSVRAESFVLYSNTLVCNHYLLCLCQEEVEQDTEQNEERKWPTIFSVAAVRLSRCELATRSLLMKNDWGHHTPPGWVFLARYPFIINPAVCPGSKQSCSLSGKQAILQFTRKPYKWKKSHIECFDICMEY